MRFVFTFVATKTVVAFLCVVLTIEEGTCSTTTVETLSPKYNVTSNRTTGGTVI